MARRKDVFSQASIRKTICFRSRLKSLLSEHDTCFVSELNI